MCKLQCKISRLCVKPVQCVWKLLCITSDHWSLLSQRYLAWLAAAFQGLKWKVFPSTFCLRSFLAEDAGDRNWDLLSRRACAISPTCQAIRQTILRPFVGLTALEFLQSQAGSAKKSFKVSVDFHADRSYPSPVASCKMWWATVFVSSFLSLDRSLVVTEGLFSSGRCWVIPQSGKLLLVTADCQLLWLLLFVELGLWQFSPAPIPLRYQ